MMIYFLNIYRYGDEAPGKIIFEECYKQAE